MDKIIAMEKEVDDIITMMKKKKIKSSSKYFILGKEMWNYAKILLLERESSSRKGFNGEPIVIV